MAELPSADREDLESCLQNCKAVVVDVSARKELVEAALESYIPGQVPLILVAYGVGTNDRKKKLARTIVEKCDPTVISGRMGDISALAMDVMDRGEWLTSATPPVSVCTVQPLECLIRMKTNKSTREHRHHPYQCATPVDTSKPPLK